MPTDGLPADKIAVLGEKLTPPSGYAADALLATAFSLDLGVAMGLPLGLLRYGDFAGLELEQIPRLAKFEAFKRFRNRYCVFCQFDGIKAPPRTWRGSALSLINAVVVPVARRTAGQPWAFHPKMVVVRFVSDNRPSIVRIICMSRNLTTDDNLDVLVAVEGEVQRRAAGGPGTAELSRALRTLPTRAVTRERGAKCRELVDDVARSVERTSFDCPPPFEHAELVPLGFGDARDDPVVLTGEEERLLVVSPFLRADRLKRLASRGSRHVVISEAAELARLDPGTRALFEQHFCPDVVVEQAASGGEVSGDEMPGPSSMGADEASADAGAPQGGLHAKLYIAEGDRHYRWLIGSANATTAAVSGNDELLVQLVGTDPALSIASFLDPDTGIGQLLTPWTGAEADEADDTDELEETNQVLAELARRAYTGTVKRTRTGYFDLAVELDRPIPGLPPAAITTRLAGSSAEAVPFDAASRRAAVIEDIPAPQVSSFLVLMVDLGAGCVARVVAMDLLGITDDELYREALRDTAEKMDLVDYLRSVISGADSLGPPHLTFDDGLGETGLEAEGAGKRQGLEAAAPLLEPLLALLQADSTLPPTGRRFPELLEIIDAARQRWPEHFSEIWTAISDAVR